MNPCPDENYRSCSYVDRADRKCEYLLSVLAHEIRNPLTLIYSTLQLLEKSYPEISGNNLWENVKQDVTDTISLLQDLTSPASADSLKMTPVSLTPLLEKLAISFKSYMDTRQVAFTYKIAPDLPELLCCMPKIRQAVLNLLLNACDAASEKKQDGHVHLSASAKDGILTIHIRDNGTGIPEENRSALFQPFVTQKEHGTGLGLSIVQDIIKRHNGSLFLSSCCEAPDTFSDFCIQIPVS